MRIHVASQWQGWGHPDKLFALVHLQIGPRRVEFALFGFILILDDEPDLPPDRRVPMNEVIERLHGKLDVDMRESDVRQLERILSLRK